MALSSIPGYLQGFIFDGDSAACYDSGIKRFKDQSSFAAWDNNHLDITTGTPTFATLNGHKGIILDNTVQGYFLCPCAFQGSFIVVAKGGMTANATIYPVIFGAATSVSSNGTLRFVRATSTNFQMTYATHSATSSATDQTTTTQAGRVAAYSFSQSTRRAYATKDGVTINQGSAVTDAGAGAGCFASATDSATEGFRARFGNISGTIGDFAASAHTIEVYEMHWFKGNLLVDNLTQLATEMAALKTKYGL